MQVCANCCNWSGGCFFCRDDHRTTLGHFHGTKPVILKCLEKCPRNVGADAFENAAHGAKMLNNYQVAKTFSNLESLQVYSDIVVLRLQRVL